MTIEDMHKFTLEVLEGMRSLLTYPANWTQCVEATDCNGNSVRAADRNARNWCLIGACMKVERSLNTRALTTIKATSAYEYWKAVVYTGYEPSLVDFNDSPTTTHADIMAILDEAIANARKQVTT